MDGSDDVSSSLPNTVIVGVVVGVVAAVLLLVSIAFWVWRRHSQRNAKANDSPTAVVNLNGRSMAEDSTDGLFLSTGQGVRPQSKSLEREGCTTVPCRTVRGVFERVCSPKTAPCPTLWSRSRVTIANAWPFVVRLQVIS